MSTFSISVRNSQPIRKSGCPDEWALQQSLPLGHGGHTNRRQRERSKAGTCRIKAAGIVPSRATRGQGENCSVSPRTDD